MGVPGVTFFELTKNQKFCATPKSGAYHFCSSKTVDLADLRRANVISCQRVVDAPHLELANEPEIELFLMSFCSRWFKIIVIASNWNCLHFKL